MRFEFIDAAKKEFPFSACARFSTSARAATSPGKGALLAARQRDDIALLAHDLLDLERQSSPVPKPERDRGTNA